MTKLARYLDAHGITQVELERRSGVSRRTISDAAAGRRDTSVDTWVRLSRALGCTIWEISEDAYAQMVGTL